MKKMFGISFLIVLIDQMVKWVICHTMNLYQSISIIPSFFSITRTQNDGAAWSILSGSRLLFILISFFALGFLFFHILKEKKLGTFKILTYGLLIGGIVGNLIDRILFGYVIDYLDFLIFHYHFPIFNIADICIVISVILLIYEIWKGEDYGNFKNNR